MQEDLVLVAAHGAVRILTLNRPAALNSFTGAMHEQLLAACRALLQGGGAVAGVKAQGIGPLAQLRQGAGFLKAGLAQLRQGSRALRWVPSCRNAGDPGTPSAQLVWIPLFKGARIGFLPIVQSPINRPLPPRPVHPCVGRRSPCRAR